MFPEPLAGDVLAAAAAAADAPQLRVAAGPRGTSHGHVQHVLSMAGEAARFICALSAEATARRAASIFRPRTSCYPSGVLQRNDSAISPPPMVSPDDVRRVG